MENSFEKLLEPEIQEFIFRNLNKNVSELALKYKVINGIPIAEVIHQIQGKQKAKNKLPTWYSVDKILFPPLLNLEQSSSEATASYKSRILKGQSLIDLTGGFGIDTTSFAKRFERVFYIERNKSLSEIVNHNLKIFGIGNVSILNTQAEEYIENSDVVDCIYIDPARRDSQNKKVFKLEDCEPNIIELLPLLFSKANQILIKTSPLLDIKSTLKGIPNCNEVHIVAVDNECKEVLYLLSPKIKQTKVLAINITNELTSSYFFNYQDEEDTHAKYNLPLKYLYEPNAAILKAGAFNSVAKSFKMFKLHPNSHLYTSDILQDDFPGRRFEIIYISKYDKKSFRKIFKSSKANITTRNFPDSVEQIRKKLDLQDGGVDYLFATTDLNNKPIILITLKS